MDSGRRSALAVRIGAEFLAIFAGAILALTADGWAERRSEQEEARAGLALILSDLEEDSIQYVVVGDKMSEWTEAAAWLILNWDRTDLPADSVELAFDIFTEGESFQVSRVGFEGLRDANRLGFIENGGVLAALRRYYQIDQPQLRRSYDHTIELVDELPRLSAAHLRYGSESNVREGWPLTKAGVELRHPWAEISRDPVLHQTLLWFGRWTGYMADSLEEAEVKLAGVLKEVRLELNN